MFERYSDQARRAIFFARYEAGNSGSLYIEPEHLLLGIAREYPDVRRRLPASRWEAFRKEIQRERLGAPLATSVDMPVSEALKSALEYAAEESDHANEKHIHCRHLFRALLRIESAASDFLKRNGIDYPDLWREMPRITPSEPETPTAQGPGLELSILRLGSLIERAHNHLIDFSEADGLRRLKHESWTRNEALGHLLDWASAHHTWFAVALTEPKLNASAYPSREFSAAQKYNQYDWRALVQLWVDMNRLILHVLSQIPESKLQIPCRIGIDSPIPLDRIVSNYIGYCEDIIAEIIVRG